MAYNLTLTDGTALATIAEATANDTATSLNLIGKGYAGYGFMINENFIGLLENFANATAPLNPLAGQLWWDKPNNKLNVYVNSLSFTGWRAVGGVTASATAPANPLNGDLWYDTTTTKLKIYNTSSLSWNIVGSFNQIADTGTGFVANTFTDSGASTRNIGNLVVNNSLAAIVNSAAASYNLPSGVNINGITSVLPGINFTSSTEQGMISSPNFRLGVINSALEVQSLGTTNSILFKVKPSVNNTLTALSINGSSGLAQVAGDPTTSLGIATKNYVDQATTTLNTSLTQYVDTSNNSQTLFTRDSINSANVKMKAYVDDRTNLSGLVTSINVTGGTTGLTTSGGPISGGSGTIVLGGTLQADNGGTGISSYAVGDLLYSDSAGSLTSLSKLAIGAAGTVLMVAGGLPNWINPITSLTVNRANGLMGGASNSLVYQSATNTTAFFPIGSQGQVLGVGVGGTLQWTTVATGSGSIDVIQDNSTNINMKPVFYDHSTGTTNTLKSSNGLSFNPSTGVLTATTFNGSGISLINLPADKLIGPGPIPSTILNNSSLYVGTTQISLARLSSAQTLTGVSIDGTAASATLATRATNLAGSTIGVIPVQTAADTTSFLPAGTDGQVLRSAGAGASPTWGAVSLTYGGTGNTQVGPSGTVAYSTGTAYAFTDGAGTNGQVLTSQGPGNKPHWTSVNPGTVTSVDLTMPSLFTVSGTPITNSGTLTVAYGTGVLPTVNGGTGSDSLVNAGIVTLGDVQTITGAKTFDTAPTFSTALDTGSGGTGLTSFTSGKAVYASSSSALTTGTLPTTAGGTGLTSFTNGGAVYATSTSALTTGTLPTTAGGTGVSAASLDAAGIVTKTNNQTVAGNKTFTGIVALNSTATAVTQAISDSSTKIATTAFVKNNFEILRSSNGYQNIADGIIIQWGRFTTASNGLYTITFPIVFPTGLASIYGTYQSGGDDTGNYLNFKDLSAAGATAVAYNQNGRTGLGTYAYLAIGY